MQVGAWPSGVIPQGCVQYKLTLKELVIYDQFTGCNKDELARAYGMTPRVMGKLIQRIRDKIKAQNRAADDAGQMDLLNCR